MNYFAEASLKGFIEDIEKKDLSTPFGGSVVILSILSSIQLIKLAIQFSIKKKGNNEDLEDYLDQLEKIKKAIIPKLDQDIVILQSIIKAQKANDPENLENTLKKAVDFCYNIFKIIFPIGDLLEKFTKKANPNLFSDLFIATKMFHANLKAAIVHIFINAKSLKSKSFFEEIEKELNQKIKESNNQEERILKNLSSKDEIYFQILQK